MRPLPRPRTPGRRPLPPPRRGRRRLAEPDPETGSPDWRRTLLAVWVTMFTAAVGLTVIGPLLPILIARELGLRRASEIAFWTGIVMGVTGLALVVASPIWGAVGDRFGRKPQLLRAVLLGGLAIGLMGLARNVFDLTGLRILQGLFSGSFAISTAIVAASTPRSRTGHALGVLGSAYAIGTMVGPALAGIAAGYIGVRRVLEVGGLVIVAASIPVVLLVREPRPRPSGPAGSGTGLAALRQVPSAERRALAWLLLCQALASALTSAAAPLMVLRLLELNPRSAAPLAGLAFGLAGLTTALAALSTGWLTSRFGYRPTSLAAAALAMPVLLLFASAPSAAVMLVAAGLLGLLGGWLGPALNSMLGLVTPPGTHGTVFGISGSATALGFGGAPLLAGLVAARFSVPAALAAGGLIAFALVLLLAFVVREPGPAPAAAVAGSAGELAAEEIDRRGPGLL